MLNVRLADGHLYGKQLFTGCRWCCLRWRLFVLSFFPLDVLDEIWNLIESVYLLLTVIDFSSKFPWTLPKIVSLVQCYILVALFKRLSRMNVIDDFYASSCQLLTLFGFREQSPIS